MMVDMVDKVCVVTGASSGIGKEIVRGLARARSKVIMVCRDQQRAEDAKSYIEQDIPGAQLKIELVDLSDLKAIRGLCEKINRDYDKLDVLINNAGCFQSARQITNENIELTLMVNYLSYYKISLLLKDQLQESGNGRIVNQSSIGHRVGKIHLDDILLSQKYDGFRAYAQSKLASIMFTYELASRLNGEKLTVNCLHPGGVKTDIGNKSSSGIYKNIWNLAKKIMISPRQGAITPLFLALSEEVEGVSGKYFYKKKPRRSSKRSYDKNVSGKLWELSQQLTSR